SSFFVALHVACVGPNQSSAFFGRGHKFRTARRTRTPSRAAKSASAPSLSARHAEGRGSAQSSERGALFGILDSRGSGRSLVRRYCQVGIREAASLVEQRSG